MRNYEPGDRTVCTSVGCGRDIEMQDTLMWVHVGSALSTCDVRYATPPQGLERELREFFDQRFAEGMRVKFGVLRSNRRQEAASHPSALLGWNTDLAPCVSIGSVVPLMSRSA